MKKILIALLLISNIAKAQNIHSPNPQYYVSPSGSSSGNGATPATAITFNQLLNLSASFKGGEHIYLQSGGTYSGDLTILSGTHIGSYGAGARPVISGTVPASSLSWTQSGGFWSANVSSRVARVFLNGSVQNNAHTSYYTISANSGGVLSTNATGLGTLPSTQEVIGKEYTFRTFFDTAVSYNTSTGDVTLQTSNATSSGFMIMFINNHSFLSATNDWAYETGTGKVYIQTSTSPALQNFSLSVYNEGIKIPTGASDINIDGIDFFGQALDGVYADSVSNIKITNCNFSKQFAAHIALMGVSNSVFIDHITGDSAFDNGITINRAYDYVLSNDTIKHVGVDKELPFYRSTSSAPIAGDRYTWPANIIQGVGINIGSGSARGLVENCYIQNVSYSGIINSGSYSRTSYCLIDSFTLRQNDGGGVYSYSDSVHYFSNPLIAWKNIVKWEASNNCISNGVGGTEAGPSGENLSAGIYLDNGNYGGHVVGNTISATGNGVLVGFDTRNSITEGNLIYHTGSGVYIINGPSLEGGEITQNVTVRNNTIASLNPNDPVIVTFDYSGSFNPFDSGGSCKNNTLISPYTNNIIIGFTSGSTETDYTLAAAQSEYGVQFGQQDPFSASYVSDSVSALQVAIDINSTSKSRYSNVPANFHNPLNKAYDPILGPYMSAVYITGTSSVGAAPGGSDGDVQINDLGSFGSPATSIFHWDKTDGLLGVGTASPAATLHVFGSGNNQLLIGSASSATANFMAEIWALPSGVSIPLRTISDAAGRSLFMYGKTNASAGDGVAFGFFNREGGTIMNTMVSYSNASTGVLDSIRFSASDYYLNGVKSGSGPDNLLYDPSTGQVTYGAGSGGTLYYQTMLSNGTPLTQQPNLNFGSEFALGTDGTATDVDLLSIPSGTTGTSQTAKDSSTKIATTLYVDRAVASGGSGTTLANNIYLPTITNAANTTSIVSDSAIWSRNGNTITVHGHVQLATVAGGSITSGVLISLPVNSNVVGGHSLFGLAVNDGVLGTQGVIFNSGTANTAALSFFSAAVSTGVIQFYYSFGYRVQ